MGDRSTPHTATLRADEQPNDVRHTQSARHLARRPGPTRLRTPVIETEIVIVNDDGTEEPFDPAALLG